MPKQIRDGAKQTLRLSVTPIAIAGLLAATIPSVPANATHINEYERCAGYMLTAGVSSEPAATACAQALRPRSIGQCVYYIKKHTPISGADALSACTRVRQPLGLANCAIDINRGTKEAEALAVLDNCRRSLIPTNFSECVVGLSRRINLPPARAMETCLSTYDSATSFSPGTSNSTPNSGTSSTPTSTPAGPSNSVPTLTPTSPSR